MRPGIGAALLLILALAFGLRVWSIGWGMPYAFHPDEDNYLPGAVRMLLAGDPNPHYFKNPPLLTYMVLGELLLYLWAGQLLGLLHSAADIGHQMLVSPAPLYVLARMNGAALGTATVLLTYLAGRRLLGARAGLFGALLLAVSFLHVRDSHYAVNDVPATFWLMLSFYFAVRIGEGEAFAAGGKSGSRWEAANASFLLSGLFLGLGMATKYNVAIGAVALVATHLLRMRRDLSNPASHLPPALAGVACLLGFVVGNPYAVLDSPALLAGLAEQYGWASDPYRTTDISMMLVMLRSLSTGMSPLVLAAAALGLLLLALRKPRSAVLLASFPLLYLGFFLLGSDLFYARFALPAIPFLAILAGYGGASAIEIARPGALRWATAAVAVAVLAAPPLLVDIKHNSLLRAEDTRQLLGQWIESNVPPGSSLVVEGYSFLDFRGRRTGPRQIEYALAIVPSVRANPPGYFVQNGFDYLVVSSYVYGRYWANPGGHADAIENYRRLDRAFPLVASFSPTADGRELPFLMDEELTPIYTVLERERPGPTLKVYRVGEPPRYSVDWLSAQLPGRVSRGQSLRAWVTVRNTGNLVWPNEGYTPVRVGYRWLDEAGREPGTADLHSSLPQRVDPGQEVVVQVDLVAPDAPGDYTLQLDLVQENFAWFSAKGGETREVRVAVD